MSYNMKTFRIKANSSKGVFIDQRQTGINVSSGYVSEIPSLWVKDGFQLIIDCYEDFDALEKHDFGSGATAKLYLKQKDSIASSITLDGNGFVTTGTIPEYHIESSSSSLSESSSSDVDEYYKVSFNVPAETIYDNAPYLAGETCIIWSEITATNDQTTFAQNVEVIDEYGDLSADERYSTADFPVDGSALSNTGTLTAYPGRVVYTVSGSGITLTLPSASTYPMQEIEILNIGAFDVTITGAVGGSVTLEVDETGHFIAIGGNWYHATYAIADE